MAAEITSALVRTGLVEALKLDLVGPGQQSGDVTEVLPQAPSCWVPHRIPCTTRCKARNSELTQTRTTIWMLRVRSVWMTISRRSKPLRQSSDIFRVLSV